MKAIILSSGGVDSTTCLAVAVKKYSDVISLSFIYGQRHFRELHSARKIADYYGIRHYELNLSEIFSFSDSAMLSDSTKKVAHTNYKDEISANGKTATYVPFRNGLMLSAAASFAGGIFEDEECVLYIGAHSDDAVLNAYPDCSENFVRAMNDAIMAGTYEKIHIEAPFAGLKKSDVVKKGLLLHVPYELTWSCYEGGERPCGLCATCRDRAAAFAENGASDPLINN